MSALGEYIHLYYKNYRQHGVARINQGQSFANYSLAVINNRIENSVKDIDKDAISELEKRLKLNSQSQLQNSKSQWQKRQQELIDEIYVLLYQRSKQVKGADRLYEVAKGDYYITNKATGETSHIKHSGHWSSSKSQDQLKAIRKKANSIYEEIENLIKKINSQSSQQHGLEDLEKLEHLYQQYTHLSYDSNEHTIGAIEKAIGENRYDGAVSNVAGNFGEMLVAICDDKVFKLANKSVADAIQESVKGNERTQILIDKNLISDNRGDNFLKNSSKDNVKYSLGTTQNKVDVEININDNDIFASVKSYSGTDTKHARPDLQQVNLLSTLTFLNNYQNLKNIGNHWINMHSSHPGRARTIDTSLDDIIKKEVAFQALSTGNPFKQGVKNANAFVFINRSTGQVYVKSIKEILQEDFTSIGGLDSISKIYLNNRKSKDFQDRITNILNQIHQQKISIGLNINFD